ncbi:MAG: hypothetical protein KDK34_00925 [Leptospiraceae bacterium]|nr:hypothetical protein [Leptospiraceae bacterium]
MDVSLHSLLAHFPIGLSVLAPFVSIALLMVYWRTSRHCVYWSAGLIIQFLIVLFALIAAFTGERDRDFVLAQSEARSATELSSATESHGASESHGATEVGKGSPISAYDNSIDLMPAHDRLADAIESHESAGWRFIWFALLAFASGGLAAIGIRRKAGKVYIRTTMLLTLALTIATALQAVRVGGLGGALVFEHGAGLLHYEFHQQRRGVSRPESNEASGNRSNEFEQGPLSTD